MGGKRYRILTKRHLAAVLALLFLAAVALVILAALIPYAYASATAASKRRAAHLLHGPFQQGGQPDL